MILDQLVVILLNVPVKKSLFQTFHLLPPVFVIQGLEDNRLEFQRHLREGIRRLVLLAKLIAGKGLCTVHCRNKWESEVVLAIKSK